MEVPWRCTRNIFKGSQGVKLYFQGGQGKFAKGVIPVKTSLPGGHTYHDGKNDGKMLHLGAIFKVPNLTG